MANQKRFYLILRDDPDGARALGPYTRHEARIAQTAHVGARIVTAAQLAVMRARTNAPRAQARAVVRAARSEV